MGRGLLRDLLLLEIVRFSLLCPHNYDDGNTGAQGRVLALVLPEIIVMAILLLALEIFYHLALLAT